LILGSFSTVKFVANKKQW